MSIRARRRAPLLTVVLLALVCAGAPVHAAGSGKAIAQFKILLQESMAKKFGLVFYVRGQTIAGMVTKITDENVVEVRNQEHERIMIRLDAIDALAH
jgi:hypothetical protein